MLKKLGPYLKPYRWKMLFTAMLTVIATMGGLLLPTLMSDALDNGISQSDLPYVLRCCAEMAAVALISALATIGSAYLNSHAVHGFCADLRNALFTRVNNMTFEEMSSIGTAGLIDRSTRDVDTLSWIVTMISESVVTIPILIVGGVFLSMSKDVTLSLIFMLYIPIIVFITLRIAITVEPLWKKADDYVDKQNELVRERMHGLRVIRAFGREEYEHGRIEEATNVMADNIIRANVKMGLVSPLAMGLLNIAAVVMTYIGALRMQNHTGTLSGGDIFAIIQYVGLVTGGIVSASWAIASYPSAKVSLGRICEIFDVKGMEGGDGRAEAEKDVRFTGDVRLDNVSFAYEGAAVPAVSRVNIEIHPGENVALIGGTGSGKSTVLQLLLGFRRPTEGSISFDGRDALTLAPATLRRNFSTVLQKAAVFSGTVRENLRMGKPDATDEEMWDALEIAQLKDFIDELPEKLDYKADQSGKNLSGGQKQRLSIARAVLKDAPLFAFDDCFSALDFLTEAKLRSALKQRLGDRTQLIITQRIGTAMHCDRIYVMDKGAVVGAGTHEELLRSCEVYREIYASQTDEAGQKALAELIGKEAK